MTRFLASHRGWHKTLHIVDLELTGVRLRDDKDQKGADVMIAVGWNRVDDTNLRQTSLLQRWHDERGRWLLDDEHEVDGDTGLLQPISRAKTDNHPEEKSIEPAAGGGTFGTSGFGTSGFGSSDVGGPGLSGGSGSGGDVVP